MKAIFVRKIKALPYELIQENVYLIENDSKAEKAYDFIADTMINMIKISGAVIDVTLKDHTVTNTITPVAIYKVDDDTYNLQMGIFDTNDVSGEIELGSVYKKIYAIVRLEENLCVLGDFSIDIDVAKYDDDAEVNSDSKLISVLNNMSYDQIAKEVFVTDDVKTITVCDNNGKQITRTTIKVIVGTKFFEV